MITPKNLLLMVVILLPVAIIQSINLYFMIFFYLQRFIIIRENIRLIFPQLD